jgi:hypothetical protein
LFQVTAAVNSSSQTPEVTNYVNPPRLRSDCEFSVIFIPRVSNVWTKHRRQLFVHRKGSSIRNMNFVEFRINDLLSLIELSNLSRRTIESFRNLEKRSQVVR